MSERVGRYYFGYNPVENSGILVSGNPVTQEYLRAMTPEAAAAFLDVCSSCCGVPWFLLLPEQEKEMAEAKLNFQNRLNGMPEKQTQPASPEFKKKPVFPPKKRRHRHYR